MTENEAKWNLDGVIKYLYKKNELGGDDNEKQYQVDNATLDLLEELQQYRAIGTVDECREARERQRAKKPLSRTHCKDGNHPLSQDIGRCPSCSSIVAEDMIWCDDCGQRLDWSDAT